MPYKHINTGTGPGDEGAERVYDGFVKAREMLKEIYENVPFLVREDIGFQYVGGLQFRVYARSYRVNGIDYNATPTSRVFDLEMSPVDKRWYVFYADTDGNIGVAQGDPAVEPVKPNLSGSQRYIGEVQVNSTEERPINIETEIVFAEGPLGNNPDGEWDPIGDGDEIYFTATEEPYAGYRHIRLFARGAPRQLYFRRDAPFSASRSINMLDFYVKIRIFTETTGFTVGFRQGPSNMGAAKVFSRSVGFGTVGFDPTMVGVWQHVTVNVENELAGKEWDGLYFGINPDTHIDFDQITVSSGSSTAQGPPQLDPKTLQDVTNEGASTDKEITARSFKVTDAPLGFLVGADGTIVDPADFGGADIDFADDLESDDNTKVLSGRAGTVIKNFLAGKASQEALDAVNSILGRKLESAEAQLLFQAYTKIFTQGEKDKLAEIDLSQLATVQSVNDILTILASDDTTLDELQEVVSYIKANRSDLANLSIPNIAGLADALSGKALQSFVLAEIAKLFPKTGGTIEGGITLKDQFNIDAAIPRIQLYVAGVRKWLAYNLPSDDSWMFKATNVIMRLFQNGNISFDMDASGNNPTMSLVDGKLYANASEVTFDVLGGKMSEIFGFDGNQVLLDNATRKPISDFVMKTGSVYSTITIDDIEYEDIQIETLSPTGDVTISVLNDRINPVMIVNGSTGIRFNLKISGTYLMIAGDKTSFLAITLDNTANSGALFRFTDNDVQVKIIDLPNVIIPFSAKIETYRVEKIIYIKVNNELRFTFDYTNRAEPEFNNPQFGIAVRAERITTYPLFAGNVEKIVELGVIDDFRERIKRLEVNYPNSAVSIFNGKKYSSLGDSVDANGQTQNKLVTDFQIAEHTNIAVSGATMSSGANSIIDQIPNIVGSIPNREPALITVGGGTNDFGKNVPLGDIDSTDTTTFYGGVRHIAETLKDIHRFNEIYFLSPTIRAYSGTGSQPSGMVNDIGLSLYDYVDAIEKVGALYGIYVVNLVDLWPVNMTNLSDFSGDGLHPNGAGHILRAQGIIDFMKKTYLG